MNKSKGFTLIELLVVIVVIGVLAAVILASLSTARNKGRDKAIVSDLASARNQISLYFSTNGTVGTYGWARCPDTANTAATGAFADAKLKEIFVHAAAQVGGTSTGTAPATQVTTVGCYGSGTNWTVAAILKENPKTAWCVDSSGVARKTTLVSNTGDFTALTTGAVNTTTTACN